MAKYTVRHSCRHTQTHQLFGKSSDRERKLAWLEDQLCTECWKADQEKKRIEAAAAAAAEAVEYGLPDLQGTEKQIAWAETIRASLTKQIESMVAQVRDRVATEGKDEFSVLPIMEEAAELIFAKDSAHWWIENRDGSQWRHASELLRWLSGKGVGRSTAELIEDARARMGGLRPPVEIGPTEIVAEAKAEATVRPASPKTETVAELLIVGNELHITFPEKHEDFRKLVKEQLRMVWADGYWKRQIGSMVGAIEDRLVEAGHMLLAGGFVIRIHDPALRARAVSGEFEPEHTRWITRRTQGAKAGWFCICWGRGEDYYAPARKLPRSQYDKPYVVVPPEHFEEVLDFAERYDFRLTQSGRELAEQARVNRDAALVAKVESKPRATGKRIAQADKPDAMTVPQIVEVDDALRDE